MEATSIPSLFTSLSIPQNHTTVGLSNLLSANSQIKSLFHHKRLPDVGWSDVQIQRLLFELSCLDTNCEESVKTQLATNNGNSSSSYPHRWTGAGEREGRIYSTLVSSRHFGLGHGIGRSGDVMEAQPKAVGSSALLRLCLRLALDAVRRGAGLAGQTVKNSGRQKKKKQQKDNNNNNNTASGDDESANNNGNGPASYGTLLPVCTGMSMALVLSGLRDRANQLDKQLANKDATVTNNSNYNDEEDESEAVAPPERNIVLWSRIDQKSCYKAILSAGLKCIVIPTKTHPTTDEVSTDLDALQQALDKYSHRILAVITTTSCFCPRVPDEVDKVAKLIQGWNNDNNIIDASTRGAGIAHVINHAYGLQCHQTNKLLNRACTIGRVDAIICSTDKNFLVPVGGALILSPNDQVIACISKNYPGRASASPMVDLFITLLSMGLNGYKGILEERRRLVEHFRVKFDVLAKKFGERMLDCPRNTISFGITLDKLVGVEEEKKNVQITKFGSMLFTRCISGTRVVPTGETKTISGHTFQGFGSSYERYPHSYMTAACAVGMGEEEMNEFFERLEKCWREYVGKREKEARKKLKQMEVKDS
mmetsp:Transcript_21360/g.35238  ORF Transcript_21360/g.35238 Transcript_21360/m.35238 type:complete len:594 (+) Transcript_21360:65-1846(+)